MITSQLRGMCACSILLLVGVVGCSDDTSTTDTSGGTGAGTGTGGGAGEGTGAMGSGGGTAGGGTGANGTGGGGTGAMGSGGGATGGAGTGGGNTGGGNTGGGNPGGGNPGGGGMGGGNPGGGNPGGGGMGGGNPGGGNPGGGGGMGGGNPGGAGGGAMVCIVDGDCDDGFSCTVDTCIAGACDNSADDTACQNGDYCDGDEVCDPATGDATTGCTVSSGDPCDDGIVCTVDSCDEVADSCSNPVDDASCDDGLACTGTEFCSLMAGACASMGALVCDDGITCTADICSAVTDQCESVPQNADCSNGTFCDGVEQCDPANGDPTTGCMAGTPVACDDAVGCTDDACNENAQACDFVVNNANCDNGDFCDGNEVCDAANDCQPGITVACDDGLPCTADFCDEAIDGCNVTTDDASCQNGDPCDGNEVCDAATGCGAGTPVNCVDDGIACTVESCDMITGGCNSVEDNGLCPMGQFCVALSGGCVASPPCNMDIDCDDGDDCNGIETCNITCQPGNPVNCNDGVACTTDVCDPNGGACSNVANDAFCANGLACDGDEVCNPAVGCEPVGNAPNCDDGLMCTTDSCLEPNGTCQNNPVNAVCDNGVFCDGPEICNAATGCEAGTSPACDDGITCTADACDVGLDACVNVGNNGLCACGEICGANGCDATCNIAECQGKVYACGDCIDNDNDCGVDSLGDDQCFGPCDNTEDSLYGGIPGQNNSPCKADCYFDQDTGAGNDDCYWSHKCDPFSVAPNYPPEDDKCEYNPNANIPGTSESCDDLQAAQSQTCLDYCGPLTPNGCDCFGCCEIPGAPTTVYMGSEDGSGNGSCTLGDIDDPLLCKPCTQVVSCTNTCENCEICIGKPDLPPECNQQTCPQGQQLCGQPGQNPCSFGFFCNTGCCVAVPD